MAKDKKFTPIGFVLYENKQFDWSLFMKTLYEDYGFSTNEKVHKDTSSESLIFDVEGATMIISFMPFPVPDGEAEENAKNNYFWKDGVEQVNKHKSNVILTMFHNNNEMSYSENYVLFIKFAASLMKCPGSIGIYTNGTVYQKDYYLSHAEMLEDDDLPTPIMIYIGLYQTKKGNCGYTYGLEKFGYREIEVINSKESLGNLYEFFFSVSQYVLEYDVTLKDGETIGFSEEQKLPIRLSVGEAVDGQSLKIGF